MLARACSRTARTARIATMANRDRLTGLDAAFLDLESGGAHMHVAAILVFAGEPPAYDDLLGAIERRLHLVPRYRQKLAFVPYGQGRPEWADDPHFNLRYHVRHSALPAPGGDAELERIAGRLFALPLDRGKPLWELFLVEGLAPGPNGAERFAVISKTHHALVDGVSGVDITSVLFDASPQPPDADEPPRAWVPRPEPTGSQLLARALVERAIVPGEGARALRAATRAPARAARPGPPGPPRAGPGRAAGPRGPRGDRGARVAGAPPGAADAAQRADRPAPPLRLGRRLARRPQGHQGRLRRHAERRRPGERDARARALAARARGRDAGARPAGDGAGLGPRPGRAGRTRQPRRRHVRAAAGRARGPARRLLNRGRRDARPQGVGPGRRRAGADAARRLRAADDRQPGRAAAGAAALLQRRRDERPRTAAPALAARARDACDLPRRPALAQPGARHRDHELQRPPRLWPARR